MEEIVVGLDDLSELHREYAAVIGLEAMIALSKNFGGTQIYVPKYNELTKVARYKRLMEDYKKGVPIKKLVKKYGISESTVYNLINDRIGVKVIPGQMNITDFLK